MDTKERLALISQVGEEIVTKDDLVKILDKKQNPIAYDGFEPSGKNIHIAQGLLRAININKMTKAGCRFKILIADWHAWANNKMNGNLEHIQKVGEYLIEVWRACDMDLKNVEFVWASDLVKDNNYWKEVMQIARISTVKRIQRCSQIMGRKEGDAQQASQILYPCMQAADIFYLGADICQLGMDQRKVNVLAREVSKKLGHAEPVIVSHHMLSGLQGPLPKIEGIETLSDKIPLGKDMQKILKDTGILISQHYPSLLGVFRAIETDLETAKTGSMDKINQAVKSIKELKEKYFEERQIGLKMSKSKPDTAIFMNDNLESIEKKLRKAYCPEGIVDDNPVLEYCNYIIFERFKKFKVERSEKWGGPIEFSSYIELKDAFKKKEVHPMDLKASVVKHLHMLLVPVQDRLSKNKKAKQLEKEIEPFIVTS
ncbi:tyrosine--tRNA ligase [Candidatus Woesearchaeota archaeon]|nr:tyrosine--tRNA ligase [Candidatus Woesearchaeota archaeon]